MTGLIATLLSAVVAASPATGSLKGATPVSGAPVLIRFSRYREAGATVRKLILRRDGTLVIDDPGGGAGRRMSSGKVKPARLRQLKRLIARAPIAHPAHRTTTLPEVDPVAYFLIRRGHDEQTVLATKVPVDLKPLAHQLNAIFDAGRAKLNSSYFVLS